MMDDQTRYALRETADSFRQFSRNGRWGSCVGCPRDSEGHAYPEFCADTDRYDHKITASELARVFESHRKTGP